MKLIHPDSSHTLTLEAIGKVPAMEFRRRENGHIEFRYVVDDEDHPGFDGQWRTMSEAEQRDTIRMGGQLADWLCSLGKNAS